MRRRRGPSPPLRPVLEDMLQQSLVALMLRLLEHHQKTKYVILRTEGEQQHQDLLFLPAACRRVRFRPVDLKEIEKRKSFLWLLVFNPHAWEPMKVPWSNPSFRRMEKGVR